jgi:hypothetical protein
MGENGLTLNLYSVILHPPDPSSHLVDFLGLEQRLLGVGVLVQSCGGPTQGVVGDEETLQDPRLLVGIFGEVHALSQQTASSRSMIVGLEGVGRAFQFNLSAVRADFPLPAKLKMLASRWA